MDEFAGLRVQAQERTAASVRAVPLAGVVFRDVADAASVELACAWRADAGSATVRAVLAAFEAAGIFADSPATAVPAPAEVQP